MDGYRFAVIHGKRGVAGEPPREPGPRHQQPRRAAGLLAGGAARVHRPRQGEGPRAPGEAEGTEARGGAPAAGDQRGDPDAAGGGPLSRRAAPGDREPSSGDPAPTGGRRAPHLARAGEHGRVALGQGDVRLPRGRWDRPQRRERARLRGMRIVQRGAGPEGEVRAIEFGQVRDTKSGPVIGMRRAGEARWGLGWARRRSPSSRSRRRTLRPRRASGPRDDEAEATISLDQTIARLDSWRRIGWEGATDLFRATWWERRGAAIAEQLARRGDEAERLPVIVDGELQLRGGPAIRDGVLPAADRGRLGALPRAGAADRRTVGGAAGRRRSLVGPPDPRDLLAKPPCSTTRRRWRGCAKQLARARELHDLSPREVAEWLSEQELDDAADFLDGYLDEPTRAFDEFSSELRRKADRQPRQALVDPGSPLARRPALHRPLRAPRGRCEGRPQVRPRPASPPTRRCGGSTSTSRAARVRPTRSPRARSAKSIGSGRSRTRKMATSSRRSGTATRDFSERSSSSRPTSARLTISSRSRLRRSRARSARAISGREQSPRSAWPSATTAKATNRIHMGRSARALDALRQVVRHLTTSAAAVAEACGVGQIDLLAAPVVVSERDREAPRGRRRGHRRPGGHRRRAPGSSPSLSPKRPSESPRRPHQESAAQSSTPFGSEEAAE